MERLLKIHGFCSHKRIRCWLGFFDLNNNIELFKILLYRHHSLILILVMYIPYKNAADDLHGIFAQTDLNNHGILMKLIGH